MTQTIVELRHVFCVHRTNEGDAAALQGADLEIAEHEVVCVLGPSGAGKSTLLRVIAGIQTPSAGLVSVLGRNLGRMAPRARASFRYELLGFLGQHAESALPPDLPAREAVALPLALRGTPARARRARVAELLDAVELGARAGALPGELSGGERQRLALYAALAHRPSLLLADEPTGELDEVNAVAVRRLIVALARTDGASVIIVSHDAATAEIAHRAVAIRDGRVVGDRRQGESALVVGRDGWLRLPSALLTQAGISGRARVGPAPGGLLITPAVNERAPAVVTVVPVAPAGSAERMPITRWRPARVELRCVTRSYGQGRRRRRVIDELTRIFQRGCLTVVTGPSGAGKSTLLRLLAGLDRPDSGLLMIDEDQLGERDDEQLATLRRRRIGYMPQEPALVGFLSARENVVLALRVRDCDACAAEERATWRWHVSISPSEPANACTAFRPARPSGRRWRARWPVPGDC